MSHLVWELQLTTAQKEIGVITTEDTLIYWGGTNDIAQSNKPIGIKHIRH
jgi:hypothetical protein